MNMCTMGSYTVIAVLILACIVFPISAASEEYSLTDFRYLTEEFPPFQYNENGEVTGLATDLLLAITKEAGAEINAGDITVVPLDEGLKTVRDTPGTVIFSIAQTPEREDLYRWVGPFTSYDIVVFAKRGSQVTIGNAEDLKSYTLGAVTGDVSIEKLTDLGVDPDALITNPDPLVLFAMLYNGDIDLVASGDVAGEYFARESGQRPGIYRIAYRMETIPLYFAFHKDTSDAIINSFTEAFERLSQTPSTGGMSKIDTITSAWMPSVGLSTLSFYTEEYYPYNFEKDGILQGISVDILTEVFSLLNADIGAANITSGSWDEGYNQALTRAGTVIFSIARSEDRENLFLWAGPMVTDKTVIFGLSSRDESGTGSCDPAGMRIGAVTDDISAEDLKNAGYTNIFYAEDVPTLVAAAEDGSIDGLAYAYLPGTNLIARYAKDEQAFSPLCTLDTHEYYFAFNRNTPVPLVRSFQEALDEIRTGKDEDGVSMYERILYRYIQPSYATSLITPDQVTELVSYTAQELSRDAKETIQQINAGNEPFQSASQPDLYVFVYDTNVTMVAHADNPSMVGANYHNKTDVTGKPFRDLLVEGALQNGTGWEDYLYSSPAETGLYWKSTAYRLVTGSDGRQYVVCAGLYKTADGRGT